MLVARDIVKAQAEAIGATFVDPIAERWFVARPDLIGADGDHPNDAGHVYLAEKIGPLIAQQLPRLVAERQVIECAPVPDEDVPMRCLIAALRSLHVMPTSSAPFNAILLIVKVVSLITTNMTSAANPKV
jgi:hypothetical protein